MPLQMAGQDARLSLTAGMGVLDRSSGNLGSVCPSYPYLLWYDLRFTLQYRAPALRAGIILGS